MYYIFVSTDIMFHLHAHARLNTTYLNYARLVYVSWAWYAWIKVNITEKKFWISFIRMRQMQMNKGRRRELGKLIGFLGRRIKCFEKSIMYGYQLSFSPTKPAMVRSTNRVWLCRRVYTSCKFIASLARYRCR